MLCTYCQCFTNVMSCFYQFAPIMIGKNVVKNYYSEMVIYWWLLAASGSLNAYQCSVGRVFSGKMHGNHFLIYSLQFIVFLQ